MSCGIEFDSSLAPLWLQFSSLLVSVFCIDFGMDVGIMFNVV